MLILPGGAASKEAQRRGFECTPASAGRVSGLPGTTHTFIILTSIWGSEN